MCALGPARDRCGMTRHFRVTLAAFAFLLTLPMVWGDWVTQPARFTSLGVPLTGLLLSVAVVLATLRRGRTPGVSPALGAIVGVFTLFGATAALVMLLPLESEQYGPGGPPQVSWVLLHFVPLWALRPRLSQWLPPAVGFAVLGAIFLGLGAHHQALAREQFGREQVLPRDLERKHLTHWCEYNTD